MLSVSGFAITTIRRFGFCISLSCRAGKRGLKLIGTYFGGCVGGSARSGGGGLLSAAVFVGIHLRAALIDRRPPHVAAMAVGVERGRGVEGAAVFPDDDVAFRPLVAVDVPAL